MEIDALLQGGGLALFVWFVIQNNREWRLYLSERNGKLEKALEKLGNALTDHARISESVHQAAERAASSSAASATSAAQSAERASTPSVIINK